MENEGPRIVIIDDETQIRRFLQVALTSHGFAVKDVGTGKDGLVAIMKFNPDIVILDLELPDIDGIEVLRQVRKWFKVPIIILSAQEQKNNTVGALDSGANDCVIKPFSMGALLARLRALIRYNTGEEEPDVVQLNDLLIDLIHCRTLVDGKEIRLTKTEFEIVRALAINAGKIMTHRSMFGAVWGSLSEVKLSYLRVYIAQIRRKLEHDPCLPKHIVTEPGIGYRLL